MQDLEGPGAAPQTIEIYGIFGEFSVAHDENDDLVTVKYFSTMASSEANSPSGNTLGLLKELKPMRERVKASEIDDLKTLLQRDLNDYRVANELVPYLQGKFSQVGFFPSVLVAVMPKGFLKNEDVDYPEPEESGNRVSYGDNWSLSRYAIGGNLTSLGVLSINPELCDLVVLDGQHRANAFRYMANALPENFSDSIYGAFYPPHEKGARFDAQLPVTIIWFESQSQVQPSFVTRKLFVDVNTNAKPVSESRNILLDDHDLCSVAVTSLYSAFAEKGFSTKGLSLLHSGFDCEDTLPKTAIFSPRTIIYAYKYLLMSSPDYDSLGKTINADFVETFKTPHRLPNFFDDGSDDIKSELKRKGIHKLPEFDKKLKEFLNSYVVDLLDSHPLCRTHVAATDDLAARISNEMTATHKEVWRDIYCGGEGLYGAIMDIGDANANLAKPEIIGAYKQAISEIDEKFKEVRADKFEDIPSDIVSNAYNTAFSKAGITGYLMAASYLASQKGWSEELVDSISEAFDCITYGQLCIVFTRFKNLFEPELNPRLWPSMRNLYLRVFDSNMNRGLFVSEGTISDHSPDSKALSKSIDRKVKSFFQSRTNEDEFPDEEMQNSWVNEVFGEVKGVIEDCGLELLINDEEVYLAKTRGYLERKLDAYRGE